MEEAFAEARRRNVPVLLSVGYAACHWCHVMAHESFEDGETAETMNRNFVNIKVDREERPDVDAVYMEATQAMTGQGGWPMTCFLTPDGEPFYCGTYFPPEPRPGMPSFRQLLAAVVRRVDRPRRRGARGGRQIVRSWLGGPRSLPESTADAEAARRGRGVAARPSYDRTHGGFGGAPKFPPSMVLEFLLRHHERTGPCSRSRWPSGTFEAMARGGMYDQLGGGFARYSVDAGWVVPHFEKMLYDNALLLRAYAHLWRAEPARRWRARIAIETAEFLPARPAHRRGRFRRRAGRRHRRRRGADLRLDARAAGRRSRGRGRRLGRRGCSR